MKKIYFFILSKSDYISFLNGLIVGGYVIGISIGPENNIYHWITVIVGLFIAVLLSILFKICKNYESNYTSNLRSNPTINHDENQKNSYDSITYIKNKKNRVLLLYPQFWIPFTFFTSFFLVVTALIIFNIGQDENKQKKKIETEETISKTIKGLDSLNKANNHKLEINNQLLRDSVIIYKEAIKKQDRIIDSLEKKLKK